MANAFLAGILVVLFIAVVAVAIATLILRRDLIECENTQSPYCLQYVCPNQKPATRTGENGETQEST